jgi:lipopolysaccharide export system permease protein
LKILDRYIFKEMTWSFLVGIGAFTITLLLGKIIRLTEMIVNKGVGFWIILRLFLLMFPSFLIITIPMATLLAILSTFGRMASDKEVVALKTAGVSLYRLLYAPALFATLACVVNLYLSIQVLPWGNRNFRNLLVQVARTQAGLGLREGVFNSELEGFIFYVRNIKNEGRVLEGILLADSREKENFKVIVARSGELVIDPEGVKTILRLSDGSIHFTFPKNPANYRELSFDQYELNLDLNRFTDNPIEKKKIDREMTLSELLAKMGEEKAAKLHPHYFTEFHKKFSIPFAAIVFTLIGIPLGIRVKRSGKISGFSLSIALVLVYYLLFSLGEALGNKGKLSPFLAVWFPNLLLGGLGAGLLFLEAKEKWPDWSSWFRR